MAAMMTSAIPILYWTMYSSEYLDGGVEGAALATIAGQFVGLVMLSTFYLGGKSVLRLKFKDFIPDPKVFSKIFTIGFATFVSTLGTSISMAFLNRGLGEYGGTAAITAMGAINSLYTLFIMPIMGVQQGMQPIIGYNHGAKQTDRVFKTLKLGILVGVVFSTVVFALLEIFPEAFIAMFLDPASATVATAVMGLRIFIIMLPLLCVNLLGIAFYQSTARGRQSFVLSILRQLVILIPAILIMQELFGLIGVWASVPVADGLAILITGIVLLITYRKDMKAGKGIKEPTEEKEADVTLAIDELVEADT